MTFPRRPDRSGGKTEFSNSHDACRLTAEIKKIKLAHCSPWSSRMRNKIDVLALTTARVGSSVETAKAQVYITAVRNGRILS